MIATEECFSGNPCGKLATKNTQMPYTLKKAWKFLIDIIIASWNF